MCGKILHIAVCPNRITLEEVVHLFRQHLNKQLLSLKSITHGLYMLGKRPSGSNKVRILGVFEEHMDRDVYLFTEART